MRKKRKIGAGCLSGGGGVWKRSAGQCPACGERIGVFLPSNARRSGSRVEPYGLSSELLILRDGRILVQNLTQPMAKLMRSLNASDRQIGPRAKIKVGRASSLSHKPFKRKTDRLEACPTL